MARTGPVGGLDPHLPDGGRPCPGYVAADVPRAISPAVRPTRLRRRPCGMSPSGPPVAGRTRGPGAPGAYHRVGFHRADGEKVFIETTRPELLPACGAGGPPDDERYQPLFGSSVRTPLFDVEVPVVAHHPAEPDKGPGIAMICTFGDTTDVTWWRELRLPTRAVIGWDGRIVRHTRLDHQRERQAGLRGHRRGHRLHRERTHRRVAGGIRRS